MAQYFTDFSDSPTLTERWDTGTAVTTIETTGLPSGSGSHAMKLVKSSSGRYFVSWDNPGSPSGDVEVLFKWQVTSGSTQSFHATLHGGGSAGSEDAYFAHNTVSGSTTTGISRVRYLAGGSSTLGAPVQAGLSFAHGTWIWTRIQRTGTTFQQRSWADGAGEGGTWYGTTNSDLSGGLVGVGAAAASATIWVAQIGVGTGGDAAPASGNAARSIHQYRMRRAG